MPITPGAEPYRADGGRVGALLCHGFTGSPAAMRPWGEFLAAAGLSVRVPRLPGHGTTWQEMQLTRWTDWYGAVERELADLQDSCDAVFVMGLSMGGTLTLRLAEEHPDGIRGIVLVNASVLTKHPLRRLLPVLRHVVPAFPGVANDIAKPGQDEVAYSKVPLQAAYSLSQLWTLVRDDLADVGQPVLLMHSREDHTVEPENADYILEHISSADREVVLLEDSYHVATLDNDAPTIFQRSLEFVRRLAPEHEPPS
ncbi:MAG: alpha/beta fold hydrolase [Actinomycetota bacterium]|nr:alpha/beta fold hydrolase [Actinomycetota bacterium]MDH5279488.1 alpha/beta fold hydrolase [Actinomycetota bacterium]